MLISFATEGKSLLSFNSIKHRHKKICLLTLFSRVLLYIWIRCDMQEKIEGFHHHYYYYYYYYFKY